MRNKPSQNVIDALAELRALGFMCDPSTCKTCKAPRCGCARNLPEADPKLYSCPCGAHCTLCGPGKLVATRDVTQPIPTRGV